MKAEVRSNGSGVTLEGTTGPEGDLVLVVPASARGTHRVVVEAKDGEELVGEAQTVYAVTNRDPELDEVAPDHAFLEWLALRTGGGSTTLASSVRCCSTARPVDGSTSVGRPRCAGSGTGRLDRALRVAGLVRSAPGRASPDQFEAASMAARRSLSRCSLAT